MDGFASLIELDGSISSLDAAAVWRWHEAEMLLEHGRRSAALYWYGFTAEFRLTAASFRVQGYRPDDRIHRDDLDALQREARKLHIMSRQPHDIAGLGRYLLHLRAVLGLRTPKELGLAVQQSSENLYAHWRPRLRYKAVSPTEAQLRVARSAAFWLRENYNRLWR